MQVLLLIVLVVVANASISLQDYGAILENNTLAAAKINAAALTKAFQAADGGGIIVVGADEVYYFFYLTVSGIKNATLILDGEFRIYGNNDIQSWPNQNNDGGPFCCFYFTDCQDLRFTVSIFYCNRCDRPDDF